MNYIALPDNDANERPLPFYLAMEEYVAHHHAGPDSLFLWRVLPTVICGRNQDISAEVDRDYCRRHDISIVQRKSGGGCVYADKGNIMLSYITTEQNSMLAFHTFINMVVLVLHRMGITATTTANNDVLISGRKVSGTACYHLPCGNIVHGTLLYDTDMDNMLHAITPPQQKLQQKGIKSVRQRITLLKDYTTLSIDEVLSLIRQTLCTGTRQLTADDVMEIERIAQ